MPSVRLPNEIRHDSEGDRFYAYYGDGEALEIGEPLEIMDTGELSTLRRILSVSYAMQVCADQATREALFNWLDGALVTKVIGAVEHREWRHAGFLINQLADADFYRNVRYPAVR